MSDFLGFTICWVSLGLGSSTSLALPITAYAACLTGLGPLTFTAATVLGAHTMVLACLKCWGLHSNWDESSPVTSPRLFPEMWESQSFWLLGSQSLLENHTEKSGKKSPGSTGLQQGQDWGLQTPESCGDQSRFGVRVGSCRLRTASSLGAGERGVLA